MNRRDGGLPTPHGKNPSVRHYNGPMRIYEGRAAT